jgi:para-nitrobenzyl esterase
MSEALLAFARNGNPNTKAIPPWPTYGLTRRATMSFDLRAMIVDDPRGGERRMFEKVPYVQPGT